MQLENLITIRIDEIERHSTEKDDFPFVLEIDGYPLAHDRLDLAQAPVGTLLVTHDGSDLEEL